MISILYRFGIHPTISSCVPRNVFCFLSHLRIWFWTVLVSPGFFLPKSNGACSPTYCCRHACGYMLLKENSTTKFILACSQADHLNHFTWALPQAPPAFTSSTHFSQALSRETGLAKTKSSFFFYTRKYFIFSAGSCLSVKWFTLATLNKSCLCFNVPCTKRLQEGRIIPCKM